MDEETLSNWLKNYIPSEEDKREADKDFRIYVLVQGRDWEGKPYWAYMSIPPSKAETFTQAQQRGSNALVDHGDILNFGYGDRPPGVVQQQMELDYDLSHNFEEQILAVAEQIKEREEIIEKYSGKKVKPRPEDSDKK